MYSVYHNIANNIRFLVNQLRNISSPASSPINIIEILKFSFEILERALVNIVPQIGLRFRRITVDGWRGREWGRMVQRVGGGAFERRNIRV